MLKLALLNKYIWAADILSSIFLMSKYQIVLITLEWKSYSLKSRIHFKDPILILKME